MKIKDIWHYFVGNLRYQLFYSKFAFLIPTHIREQIEYRIEVMDDECFDKGQCKICGCTTTALQMANKACPKPCYPRMMNKRSWKIYKEIQDGLEENNN